MASVKLTGPNGEDGNFVLSRVFGRDIFPTQGDLVALAVFHQGMILERTAAGLDADFKPFAPYSDIGPIYVNLSAAGSLATPKQRTSAAQRLSKKVGRPAKVFKRKDPISRAAKRAARRGTRKPASLRRIAGVTPIGGITPGGYLKAASYDWLKRIYLGRSAVDLLGIRAPHMLQALVLRYRGGGGKRTTQPPLNAMPEKPTGVELGLFGEEAGRGEGHNVGAGALPRRRWLDFGRNDGGRLAKLLLERIERRLGR